MKIKQVSLPKDNGPHENTIEWWYFNGHLTDATGKKYSFMDCFFKVDFIKVGFDKIIKHKIEDHHRRGNYLHFAHSVVSDISKKKNYKEIQKISLLSHDSFKKDKLYINYHNLNFFTDRYECIMEEKEKNGFHMKTANLDLNLKSKKKPLLEGGHGYVGTPKDGSYYYSLTDMQASGNIKIENKEIKVKGKVWMDHQWADGAYKKDRWTWFSFQLQNGMEIMCVKYDRQDKSSSILINTIDKNGKQKEYQDAIFTAGIDLWKSDKTKISYPMSWKIEIPKSKIIIETKSVLRDQEMNYGEINYFEGPMEVKVKINNKKIKGLGFMELVGY